MAIFIAAVRGSARSRSTVSNPSSRGIFTSIVMTSGPHVEDLLQGVQAVDRLHDLEALELEVDGDQLPDDVAVVDDQHAAQDVAHARRLTAPVAGRGRLDRLITSGSARAPVAQGIEHRPPEAVAQVRILPGAPI